MFSLPSVPISSVNSNRKSQDFEVPDPKHPAYIQIRDLIYQTSGIYHSSDKLYLMAERCARRMKVLGVSTPADYLTAISKHRSDDKSELRLLLNEMTVGETYMLRNPAQLEALRSSILPQLVSQECSAQSKHLRIWSAGCSTGEEPYTLAMFLLELGSDVLKGWTFEILATDINDRSLEIAQTGIYGEYALRNASQLLRTKYFTRCDNIRMRIHDNIKSLVHFSRANLNDPGCISALGTVHVIFCCNVLIYFDMASKSRVIDHFYSALRPGGYLFLGHAESLFQVNTPLHLIHFPRATAYLKPLPQRQGGSR